MAREVSSLVQRYSGNPLALKLVARTIQELFDGDMAAFLGDEAIMAEGLIFDDIRMVLEPTVCPPVAPGARDSCSGWPSSAKRFPSPALAQNLVQPTAAARPAGSVARPATPLAAGKERSWLYPAKCRHRISHRLSDPAGLPRDFRFSIFDFTILVPTIRNLKSKIQNLKLQCRSSIVLPCSKPRPKAMSARARCG